MDLKDKINKVKALVLDVDGVLTNGEIIYDSAGNETKIFDVQDGFGIVFFRKAGFKTAIITARSSEPVTIRAKDLKIDKVYQDAYPKITYFEKLVKEFDLTDNEICYVGDDLTDLQVLCKAGFSVAVSNADNEVKKIADYVTEKEGGRGAVREVVELILKTQGKWDGIVKDFKEKGCV